MNLQSSLVPPQPVPSRGGGVRVTIIGVGVSSRDAAELTAVADAAGGQYLHASDAGQLRKLLAVAVAGGGGGAPVISSLSRGTSLGPVAIVLMVLLNVTLALLLFRRLGRSGRVSAGWWRDRHRTHRRPRGPFRGQR